MATITELLDLPAGGTPDGATVSIELVGAKGLPVEGFVTGTATIIGRLAPTVTAGAWSAVLVANDSITPSGTVYKRTVKPRAGKSFADYFEVPTGSDTHTLYSCLTEVPASIATSTYAALEQALAAHAASRGLGGHLPDAAGDAAVPIWDADVEEWVAGQRAGTVAGTAANLASDNPVLPSGWIGKQTDAPYLVGYGDGMTAWNDLPKYHPIIPGAYQHAATPTGLTGVGTGGADWPLLTIDVYSDGVTPTELEAYCAAVNGEASVTTATYPRLAIYEGAALVTVANGANPTQTGTNARMPAIIARHTQVFSEGVHTFKVNAVRSAAGAGSLAFLAGVGFEAYLRSKPMYQ